MATEQSGRFVSGEAVELDVRVALVGSRMLAFGIDLIVQLTLLFLCYLGAGLVAALAFLSGVGDVALLAGMMTVAVVVALVGYPLTLETLTGGRSLGKLALGLRVVRDDGGPIRFRHSLVRVLVGLAADFPGLAMPPLTWVASLSTALVHPYGKRFGDLAAGTVVVHERSPVTWGWPPPAPPHLAGWAATLDLSGLDDELALTVRGYLARSGQLTEPARGTLCAQLAAEVARRTDPPPPTGLMPWWYLAAVLGERFRRERVRLAMRRQAATLLWPEIGDRPPPAPPPGVPGQGYGVPAPSPGVPGQGYGVPAPSPGVPGQGYGVPAPPPPPESSPWQRPPGEASPWQRPPASPKPVRPAVPTAAPAADL